MQGQVVISGKDIKFRRIFAIRERTSGMTFPVEGRQVCVRRLRPGANVKFVTDAETGSAEIVNPDPEIGCRGSRERAC